MDRKLIYFADPMCSWCWGFQPVMSQIATRLEGEAEIVIFVGGLRPYTEHVMTDKDKSYVRNHWEHVQEATGQVFDFGLFDRTDFTYDTEPACRAVVAARLLDAGKAHAMLNRLHEAFYAEGKDVTKSDVLAELAGELGLDPAAFAAMHASEEARQLTLAEFQYTQRSQIGGFPTLVGVAEGAQPVALTMGYQPWQSMQPIVESWLSENAG